MSPRRSSLLITGVMILSASAAWSLWPLHDEPLGATGLADAAPRPTPSARTPLDRDAFRAPLWVAPPAPPPQPAAAPPPPPMRLQLIAIVRDADGLKASIYDPDADSMLLVGTGDTVAGRTIARVAPGIVELRDKGLTRVLSLRSEGGAP